MLSVATDSGCCCLDASYCLGLNVSITGDEGRWLLKGEKVDLFPKTRTDYGGTLKWTSKEQSYILASFYWAYIISQIVGGLATQKLGTKRVFGYAQLATALCSICIPWASETHYGLVIGLRFIQGFASGLTWPAMYALVGHWIPVPERSRFMSSFQGFSIGIGITYPLCGFLIAHLGWRSVFYTTGSIGILWCVIWYLLAFDSPETHPRISLREQQYIKENTNNTYENSRTQAVPWKKILTSLPAWSIGVTTFGRIWVHYIFIVSGPTYMKSILGFSIEKNGLLSGAPFICSYVASVLFCYIADKLITNNYMSLTNVRKLMTALCKSPNFAGPVLAFAQTIHMSASFLSPLVAFHMLEGQEQNMSAWRNVFYVTCFIAVVTYIAFQIWGTGDVQPWNYHGLPTTTPEQEELMNEKSPEKKYPNNTDEVQA
uniref:Sialin-like n=1 Tax=Diabrotica virgifera virgifera TaxID=50390 RepID=A0A6P7F9W5_DIAVI